MVSGPRAPQALQQTRAGQAAHDVADHADDFAKTARFAGSRRRHSFQAFGEDLSAAVRVTATKAPCPQTQVDLPALPRQIHQFAVIGAMVRDTRAEAGRARWRCPGANPHLDAGLGLSHTVDQQLAWTRQGTGDNITILDHALTIPNGSSAACTENAGDPF